MITDGEVSEAIMNLNIDKAVGPDLLHAEFYKYFKDFLIHILTVLYNFNVFPEGFNSGLLALISVLR